MFKSFMLASLVVFYLLAIFTTACTLAQSATGKRFSWMNLIAFAIITAAIIVVERML